MIRLRPDRRAEQSEEYEVYPWDHPVFEASVDSTDANPTQTGRTRGLIAILGGASELAVPLEEREILERQAAQFYLDRREQGLSDDEIEAEARRVSQVLSDRINQGSAL